MFYDFTFTIPTTAKVGNPEEMELKLPYGVVHKVSLFWWPGPHGLVHLIIKRHEHQVLPTNLDGTFHYDNYTHVMEERIELFTKPYTLKLEGWGEDLKYPHDVIVGIGILPPSCFPEYATPDTRLAKLLKLIGMR
ncbi:hypothetical protein ES708_21934 [subsurface metagenome]